MLVPSCPVAATCGGCPLIAMTPARARAMRENRLRDALQKHGSAAARMPFDWVAMRQPEGYRCRIRLRVFEDAHIGFFNAGKYGRCAVLTASLRQVMSDLLGASERFRDTMIPLHHLDLREPDMDAAASVYFVKREPDKPLTPTVVEHLGEWLDGIKWAVAGETDPVPCQRRALPSVWQYVPIGSFLQVNPAINAALVSDLVTGAKRRELSTFCDLFAGSGNFTLPLLAAGLTGQSIELDLHAARAARLAAKVQNLPHDGIAVGDAGTLAVNALFRGRTFDLVIVDPPRAGVRQGLQAMAAVTRSHLVYCSCNLDTLARDLGLLNQAHFEIESVTLYDMFAHTERVEALVWLRAPMQAAR